MGRYRKKPVEIEAVQWDGDPETATPIIDWIMAEGGTATHVGPTMHSMWCRCDGRGVVPGSSSAVPCPETQPTGPDRILIDTLEGQMIANRGDWIIRGVKGEFYPCKPDIFEATYEEVFVTETGKVLTDTDIEALADEEALLYQVDRCVEIFDQAHTQLTYKRFCNWWDREEIEEPLPSFQEMHHLLAENARRKFALQAKEGT